MLWRTEEGDGKETLEEFLSHVQPSDQAGRQAGNMQCSRGLVGGRGRWGKVSEERKEVSLKKGIPVCRRDVGRWWRRYSLVLLRTHADEGDGTVRKSGGEGGKGR